MKIDKLRIQRFLYEIKKNTSEIEDILKDKQAEAQLDPLIFKAVKYMLVEIAEAISNVLQHILCQDKGILVSGYIETILKAREYKIISESTFKN